MIDYTGSIYRGKSFLLPLFWDRDLNLNVFGLIFDSKYNKETLFSHSLIVKFIQLTQKNSHLLGRTIPTNLF